MTPLTTMKRSYGLLSIIASLAISLSVMVSRSSSGDFLSEAAGNPCSISQTKSKHRQADCLIMSSPRIEDHHRKQYFMLYMRTKYQWPLKPYRYRWRVNHLTGYCMWATPDRCLYEPAITFSAFTLWNDSLTLFIRLSYHILGILLERTHVFTYIRTHTHTHTKPTVYNLSMNLQSQCWRNAEAQTDAELKIINILQAAVIIKQ